jgi:hypothetical protein
MAIYFDGTHLMGTDIAELHTFAQSIGLKSGWFQNHPTHPHYDVLSKSIRAEAFTQGATSVTTREMVQLMLSGKLAKGTALKGETVKQYRARLDKAAQSCRLAEALQVIQSAADGQKPTLRYYVTAQDPQTRKFVKVGK